MWCFVNLSPPQKVALGEAPQRITHHETGRVFGIITTSYRVVENRWAYDFSIWATSQKNDTDLIFFVHFIQRPNKKFRAFNESCSNTFFSLAALVLVEHNLPVLFLFSDEEEEHIFVKFLDDTNFEELYCHPLDPFEVRHEASDGTGMFLQNGSSFVVSVLVVEKWMFFVHVWCWRLHLYWVYFLRPHSFQSVGFPAAVLLAVLSLFF